MANHQNEQFIHVDPRTAAEMRRRGTDPREMEQSTQVVLHYLRASLPATPLSASAAARLSALPGPDPSGEDHLSALPFSLLRDIVSRLPPPGTPRAPPRSPAAGAPSGAARRSPSPTPASSRVSPRAAATPCAPTRRPSPPPSPASSPRTRAPSAPSTSSAATWTRTSGSSRAGPARSPPRASRSSSSSTAPGRSTSTPTPHPPPPPRRPPAELLDAATLTRLYLGVWKFPDTSGLPRGAAPFPHLRELVLCCVDIENRDMDTLLAGCPVLEIFGMLGNRKDGMRLHLAGQRLRCVQISMSVLGSVAVVDAPSLQRLFVWELFTHDGSCIRVRIGNAPKLRLLGHLRPGVHMLEIRDTVVINAGIRASPSAMAPNVKILGLNVCFGARYDAKMLSAFLGCFPNVEALHIVSQET